jgi:hypothetical protein
MTPATDTAISNEPKSDTTVFTLGHSASFSKLQSMRVGTRPTKNS